MIRQISSQRERCLILDALVDLFNNEYGATAIEYGLITALIAVGAVAVMGTVGL
jgi:Flp pilus assembly pilin Flp